MKRYYSGEWCHLGDGPSKLVRRDKTLRPNYLGAERALQIADVRYFYIYAPEPIGHLSGRYPA